MCRMSRQHRPHATFFKAFRGAIGALAIFFFVRSELLILPGKTAGGRYNTRVDLFSRANASEKPTMHLSISEPTTKMKQATYELVDN